MTQNEIDKEDLKKYRSLLKKAPEEDVQWLEDMILELEVRLYGENLS